MEQHYPVGGGIIRKLPQPFHDLAPPGNRRPRAGYCVFLTGYFFRRAIETEHADIGRVHDVSQFHRVLEQFHVGGKIIGNPNLADGRTHGRQRKSSVLQTFFNLSGFSLRIFYEVSAFHAPHLDVAHL